MTERELLLAEIEEEIKKFESVVEKGPAVMMKEVDLELSIREAATGTAYVMTEIAELVEEVAIIPVENIPEKEVILNDPVENDVQPEPEVEPEKKIEIAEGPVYVENIAKTVSAGFRGSRKEVVKDIIRIAAVSKPAEYKYMRGIVSRAMENAGESDFSYFKLQNFTDSILKKLKAFTVIEWEGKAKSPITWNLMK